MKKVKTLMAFALVVALAPAANAYVVGGNGSNVASASGVWAWNGAVHAEDRTILENASVFGPGGTVVGDTIETVDLAAIDAASLGGLDAFVSSWWRQDQSAPYDSLVVDFFLNGGDLFLFNDGPDRDSIADLLGVPTIQNFDGNPNVVTPSGALDGPFGTGDIFQGGQIGVLSEADILAAGGSVCARAAGGLPTAACWAAGAYAAGAGNLVVLADVDMLSGSSYAGTTPLNGEAQLWLNMFAFAVNDNGSVAVPAPGSLALLCLGLAGLGFSRRR